MTIKAQHRKHYKSGSCLNAVPLGHSKLEASKKFMRMLAVAHKMFKRRQKAS